MKCSLAIGERQRIEGFRGDALLQSRLQEIGFFSGAEIQCLGRAPLNGPILIQFGAMTIALRDEEFNCLVIQKITAMVGKES